VQQQEAGECEINLLQVVDKVHMDHRPSRQPHCSSTVPLSGWEDELQHTDRTRTHHSTATHARLYTTHTSNEELSNYHI